MDKGPILHRARRASPGPAVCGSSWGFLSRTWHPWRPAPSSLHEWSFWGECRNRPNASWARARCVSWTRQGWQWWAGLGSRLEKLSEPRGSGSHCSRLTWQRWRWRPQPWCCVQSSQGRPSGQAGSRRDGGWAVQVRSGCCSRAGRARGSGPRPGKCRVARDLVFAPDARWHCVDSSHAVRLAQDPTRKLSAPCRCSQGHGRALSQGELSVPPPQGCAPEPGLPETPRGGSGSRSCWLCPTAAVTWLRLVAAPTAPPGLCLLQPWLGLAFSPTRERRLLPREPCAEVSVAAARRGVVPQSSGHAQEL